ncbi:MAG: hypothetical protein H6686_12065 [Fibrobacteria bacterium]|nr:hypothetical protein [Fibrobacteria bacterium]
MNTKLLSASLLALGLLASCDNGVISGPTYADISARVTPWRGVFDSMGIDVRVGSFRGALRESYMSRDPDQVQLNIPDLPVGEWTMVAVYYKTYWDTTVTPHRIKGTGHRAAVAQGEVTVSYDPDCDCSVVKGDNVDLRLAN